MTDLLRSVSDVRVIAVDAARIDREAVDAIERQISAAVDAGHRRIVVDLGEVTCLPLPTLSRFCGALRRSGRRAQTLATAGGPPHVRRTVALCAIDGMQIHPTVAAALASHEPAAAPAERLINPSPVTG